MSSSSLALPLLHEQRNIQNPPRCCAQNRSGPPGVQCSRDRRAGMLTCTQHGQLNDFIRGLLDRESSYTKLRVLRYGKMWMAPFRYEGEEADFESAPSDSESSDDEDWDARSDNASVSTIRPRRAREPDWDELERVHQSILSRATATPAPAAPVDLGKLARIERLIFSRAASATASRSVGNNPGPSTPAGGSGSGSGHERPVTPSPPLPPNPDPKTTTFGLLSPAPEVSPSESSFRPRSPVPSLNIGSSATSSPSTPGQSHTTPAQEDALSPEASTSQSSFKSRSPVPTLNVGTSAPTSPSTPPRRVRFRSARPPAQEDADSYLQRSLRQITLDTRRG